MSTVKSPLIWQVNYTLDRMLLIKEKTSFYYSKYLILVVNTNFNLIRADSSQTWTCTVVEFDMTLN
jgi:hypothetical protein